MSASVGIDLTSHEEVRDSIDTFGERYLRRIYTPRELAECGQQASRLAARFATKEAAAKALRAPGGLPWRSIELRHGDSQAPRVVLSEPAAALARERGVTDWNVSVSQTRSHAVAVVWAAP
ncbi:MAG TPA: holo-ACP synthase [Solirubrobacteraceae bacterium]